MVHLKSNSYKTRILIIDDDPSILDWFKIKLKRHPDIKLVIANDSYLGYKKSTLEKFDYIITDYQMPKINGLEMIDMLRRNQLNKHAKIVMMTTNFDKIDDTIVSLKNVFCLKKPLVYRDVIALLKNPTQTKVSNLENLKQGQIENISSVISASLVNMCKLESLENPQDLEFEELKNLSYDYFSSFLIKTELFTSLFSIGFPKETFLKFAYDIVDHNEIDDIQDNLDEFLSIFMNILFSKLKIGLDESNMGVLEMHSIVVTGQNQSIKSQDAKVEFIQSVQTKYGLFYLQIDYW